VTQNAYRYGFTHAGRFAAIYRARYGEPPTETLRR
jgi:AraC-like DNA-binding protein